MQTAQKALDPDIQGAGHQDSESRRAARIITVYRVARVNTGRDAGFCRIHNISDFGAMLMTSLVANPGDSVLVSLSETVHVSGEVVWRDGARLGIEFTPPIDAAAMLKSLAVARESGGERPTRLPTNTVAAAATPYGTGAVTIRNISQQGMQVTHDGSFTVGLPVKVALQNGLERRGIVRWSRDNVAGLRLLEQSATVNWRARAGFDGDRRCGPARRRYDATTT